MKTLFLVSCSRKKHVGTHQAQELYCSALFLKSKAYVLSQLQPSDQWLILSAKHGAVYPDQVIKDYDRSLATMTPFQRQQWANWVWLGCLFEYFSWGKFDRLVFLAGKHYQKHLRFCLEGSRFADIVTVEDPLHGLEIGQRLQWLALNTKRGT